MKNTTLSLTAMALACCLTAPAFAQSEFSRGQSDFSRAQSEFSHAQSDSSRLDVGYLHLKRDFTQNLTVKGSDLERMPFTNLSDAIAAWFYGAYTQSVTLQYVVDGNPVSDVNAYSIHDIEEVVLVQNAAALVNTANGQQELVIVRTRRGQGKRGFTADARTGLVNDKADGQVSDLRFYHNYYVTAWQNLDKVSFGLSGNYLRDAFPFGGDGLNVVTPNNLERWRLNGYLTWRPNSHNQVEIMLNYTPQRMASVFEYPSTYLVDDHSTQHFIFPRLLWHSDLSSKWTNDLQATYIHSTRKESDYTNDVVQQPNDSLVAQYNGITDQIKSYHLWIRDRLGYKATAGHWTIEPAINASYEHFNEQATVGTVQTMLEYNGGSLMGIGSVSNVSEILLNSKEDMVVLTPAIDISYKRVLDVQGGVLVDAGKQKANSGRFAFPFASVTLDLLKLTNDHAASDLKVFGSYAQRAMPSPQGYMLSDLTTDLTNSNSPVQNYNTYNLNTTTNYTVPYYPGGQVYWVWETGVTYAAWGDRLTIQYTFEQRNFLKSLLLFSNGGISFAYPDWRSTLQHVDIRVKVLDAEGVRWLTGLNATLLQNKSPFTYSNQSSENGKQDIGDDSPNPSSWTGGWVNRVQVKRFTAGFDLLYHFGESVLSQTYSGAFDTVKVNSVITPNIYVGYSWHLPGAQTLECFVESRGLIQNSKSDLLDDRRYYTVGGKLSL
jgi:hypothetical protein